jgi:pyrroloquinoline-quinone synthase
VLAAPPPPIPALTEPLDPDDLAAALRAFSRSYYANHPFHQLMHEGRLTKRQLQGWVANRPAYQRAIPRKDAAILSNCPDPDVRRLWLQRIVDHDGTGPGSGGIELWIGWAKRSVCPAKKWKTNGTCCRASGSRPKRM